jgi:hypothetical protein
MPSKKQVRRQQKLKRHEYEEVYVDDEGNELAPEEAEELLGASQPAKAAKAKAQPTGRGGRTLEPPSWRRTGRRGLLFFPLMLIVVFLISPELTTTQKIVNTVVLMGFFLPFSYFMDSMMWRSFQKRLARSDEPTKR